jgi:hypothetical protein
MSPVSARAARVFRRAWGFVVRREYTKKHMCAECCVCAGGVRVTCPGGLAARGDCTQKPTSSDVRVCARGLWWRAMTATKHVIRWSTAGAVVGVAPVAAVAPYEHAYALVRRTVRPGGRSRLVPLTVDGLI